MKSTMHRDATITPLEPEHRGNGTRAPTHSSDVPKQGLQPEKQRSGSTKKRARDSSASPRLICFWSCVLCGRPKINPPKKKYVGASSNIHISRAIWWHVVLTHNGSRQLVAMDQKKRTCAARFAAPQYAGPCCVSLGSIRTLSLECTGRMTLERIARPLGGTLFAFVNVPQQ